MRPRSIAMIAAWLLSLPSAQAGEAARPATTDGDNNAHAVQLAATPVFLLGAAM